MNEKYEVIALSSKSNIKAMEDNKDLNGLIMALKDDDVFVRRNATKAIGRLGIKYNAENINTYSIRIALHDALNDKDHLVKKYAKNTLLEPSFNREHSNSANALPAGKIVSETSNNIKERLDDKDPGWFKKQSSGKQFILIIGSSVLGIALLIGILLSIIALGNTSNAPAAISDNNTSSVSNNSISAPSNLTSSDDTDSSNTSSTIPDTQSDPPSTTADADNGYQDGYSYGYDDGLYGEDYWDGLSSSIPMSGAYRVGYKDGYKHGYADGKRTSS